MQQGGNRRWRWLALALLASAAQAGGADIRSFARAAEFSQVRLSPGGAYIAVGALGDDETNLAIIRLSDMKLTGAIRSGAGRHVHDFWWANNERVVATYAEREGVLDTPLLTGEMLAVNADGSRLAYLYGYKGGAGSGARLKRGTQAYAHARMVSTLASDPERVLISSDHFFDSQRQEQYSHVYRLHVESGKIQQVARAPMRGRTSFLANLAGEVRFATSIDPETLQPRTYLRDAVTDEWRAFATETRGISLEPIALSADERSAYLEVGTAGGRSCLARQDMQSGVRSELSCDPVRDMSWVLFAADRTTPIGVVYGAALPRVHWIAPEHPDTKLLMSLEQSFPGQLVVPESWSEDGKRLVFRVASDRNPGEFYLLDRATRKAQFLLASREWIDPQAMSRREAFTYRARDASTRLHGQLTHPPAATTEALPLIVYVHGGPFGVFDSWFWDADAQLLASHGYRVLQPNFRGSGGFGAHYRESARQAWGTMMIDDIVDGTRDLIARGLADPARICIYGGSYGAYAALMSAVREPDLYRCVIAYAGVYDLVELKKDSDIRSSRAGRRYIDMYIGGDDEQLRKQSPVHAVDRLRAPVLIAHGGMDTRAPFNQAQALRQALEQHRLPYEWMEKSTEGHGFSNAENRAELYQRMLKFLDTHIGPAVTASAAVR